MPVAMRAGHLVHWQDHESGGAPERALAIHPVLAGAGAFAPLAGALEDVRLLTAFDLPGHGKSAGWDGRGDYHALATAIAADFCNPPCDVIGHSLGATIALRLALERPDRVKRLVLIEPVLFAAARGTAALEAEERSARTFAAALELGDFEAAARAFIGRWGLGDTPWNAIPGGRRARIVARMAIVAATRPVLHDDSAEMLAQGRLEGLACPVLLLEGAESPSVIGAINAALGERIPHCRRVVLEGAGHMLPITHADAVAREIRAFVSV